MNVGDEVGNVSTSVYIYPLSWPAAKFVPPGEIDILVHRYWLPSVGADVCDQVFA
jgi:hypothetical protein